MCSFGGRIEKRPTDSSLCYLGGETRMVKIDRQASLADLRALLSQFFAGGRLISLKYQIPGVHLDSLVSIFTEEDLKVFISECDRAENAVVSRSRIRLFVFEAGKPEPISSVASLPVLSENTTTLHKNVAEQKERPSRTLFVRNISSNVEDSELLALFGPFGDIHSLYTGTKHRGFIMISYFDIRNAQTAMNELQNKPLRRRKLDIYFTVPKEDSFNKDLDEGALVVSTIDPSLSSKEILQTFRAYGEVREIRDRPQETNNKFIIAEYYDTRAAHAARQSLICGETMKNESVFPDGMYMKYDFELESHQQGSGPLPQARRPDTSKYVYSELKSEDCLFSLEDDDHAQGSLDWSPPILFHCFKDHLHTITHSNTFGRDDIRESITTLIMSNINEDTLSVISIVAKSGAGKATLVRLIYQDRRVSDSFDKQMWIRMSDKFDARCLMIAILGQATQVQCDITDLHLLMEHVKAELTDKKFLLVLENCVLESQRFWSNALEYLNIGAKGSFIIITTPKETVSSVSRSMSFYLRPLQDVHCLQIFQQYTCDENHDPDRHRSLEKFSRTVRYRCGGNPLYLKAVCGLFCHSNSSLQLMDYFEKESLQDLELYYSVLPPHLKLCLQLCSLFPKEYVYSQQHLVQLWMSQGFINCDGHGETENIGTEYFNELVCRSFFNCLPLHNDRDGRYVMHGLFHDLITSLSKSTCFRHERHKDHLRKIPEQTLAARHLSVIPWQSETIFALDPVTRQVGFLDTFLIINRSELQHTSMSSPFLKLIGLHDFFQKFQSLKTLNLSFTFIDQLPSSIGNLKHLQYLAVNNTDLKNLPSEICSLDELQTLEARNCCYLLTLPQNIRNLKKLGHLDVRKQPGRVRVPRGVGHLVHLKTLPVLNVGEDSFDCSILELRDLDNLCGDLVLTGLENVKAGDNCKEAKLINKKYLKILTLEWSDNNVNLEDDNDEIAAEVFQSLEPPSHLESLTVRNYSGSLFPVWIEKSPFDNLQSITLDSCYNCCMLPALGDLQSLRYLCLRKMYALKTFGYTCSLSEEENGGKFPALELLKLWEMYELDGWIGVKDGDFPRLHTVSIVGCPILKSLPHLPSLVDLSLHRCNQLPEIPELVKLKSLKIEGFQDMVSLDLPQGLPALKNLEIIRCNKLESLVGLSTLSSVERLKIVKCPNLDVVNKWQQYHFKNIRTSRDATVI